MRYVLVLLPVLPALLWTQEFRGTLRGRILDPSGAAVAGAAVEVVNTETNVRTTSVSNEAGNYQVPFLLPGNYTVRVEHPGFKTLERQGIRVSLNELVTLDLTLELGQTTESVTVTAAAPLLNTATADLGQVIERTLVETMVVSLSRNVINLRNLAPGVTGGTGTYTSSAQGDFSIAGGGGTRGDNEVVVDGIPSTTVDGTIGFVPALDAVEEVKVHTTMFDAAFGHSNGGALTITTRGGTNEVHGTAFLYKRWAALNANSWTNNRLGLAKPPVTYHQWGYALSGPVYLPRLYDGRNRTFFSTTLERDHDARELTRQARVPTEAERKGDFSRTLNRLGGPFAIYDPLTTVVEGTRATRQPFPGAVIPAARISPIGAAVLGKYPLPNQPAATQIAAYNWGLSKTYAVDQHQYSGRVDHAISDRQRLFVRLGVLDRIQMADELIFGAISFPVSGGSDLDRPLARRRFSLAVDDTIVVSPNLVGSVRLGVLSYTSRGETGAAGADPSQRTGHHRRQPGLPRMAQFLARREPARSGQQQIVLPAADQLAGKHLDEALGRARFQVRSGLPDGPHQQRLARIQRGGFVQLQPHVHPGEPVRHAFGRQLRLGHGLPVARAGRLGQLRLQHRDLHPEPLPGLVRAGRLEAHPAAHAQPGLAL